MTNSNNATPSTTSATDEGTTALTAIATTTLDRNDSRTQQRQPPSILRRPSTDSSNKGPNKNSTRKPRSVQVVRPGDEKEKEKNQKKNKVPDKIAKSIVTHLKEDEHVQSQPEALKRYIETSALQLNKLYNFTQAKTAVRSKFQNKDFVPTSARIKTPMKYSSNLKDDKSMSELVKEFEQIKEEFKKKTTEVFKKANEIEIESAIKNKFKLSTSIFLKIGEIMADYMKNRNKNGIYSAHISDTIVAARAFYACMDEVQSFKRKLLCYLEIQEEKLFAEIKEQIPGTDLNIRGLTEDDKSLVEKVSTELLYIIPPMSYDIQNKLDAQRSILEEESRVEAKVKSIQINEATEATFIAINAEQSVSAPQLIQLIREESKRARQEEKRSLVEEVKNDLVKKRWAAQKMDEHKSPKCPRTRRIPNPRIR
jgi:hypothetical protein